MDDQVSSCELGSVPGTALVREQTLLVSVLTQLRSLLPFPLLGLDVDNDSVFMNESVRDYCRAEGIVLTRCRPYRKNDQAHIEQKNGAIVRRIVGYHRYEGLAAARELARLYATTRLFVNAFQPSFKLAEKEREGARVRKRYHAPATPSDRLLADPRTSNVVRQRVETLRADLDPVRLTSRHRVPFFKSGFQDTGRLSGHLASTTRRHHRRRALGSASGKPHLTPRAQAPS